MGRRAIKEYRAPEALTLITADRDGHAMPCPSCGHPVVDRTPARDAPAHLHSGRVTLHCAKCGRSAAYVERALDQTYRPEAPSSPHR